MKPHLCIEPQCPATCEGCAYAVPPDDTARQLIARLLCTFALTHDRQPFADGANPLVDRARAYLRNPGPRLWILECGAVGFPHGNPSRLTTFEAHDTEGEAHAAAEASEFNSRVFSVFVPPDGVTAAPARKGLRYHYGADEKPRCDDCNAEVYGFNEGLICSGCGAVEAEEPADGVKVSGGPCPECGRGEVFDGKCDRCNFTTVPAPARPLTALREAEKRTRGVPAPRGGDALGTLEAALEWHRGDKWRAGTPDQADAWRVQRERLEAAIEALRAGVMAAQAPDTEALQWAVKTLRFLMPGTPVGPHAAFEEVVNRLALGVAAVVAPRMSDAEIDKVWRDTPAQGDPTGKLFYRYFARAVLAANGVEVLPPGVEPSPECFGKVDLTGVKRGPVRTAGVKEADRG